MQKYTKKYFTDFYSFTMNRIIPQFLSLASSKKFQYCMISLIFCIIFILLPGTAYARGGAGEGFGGGGSFGGSSGGGDDGGLFILIFLLFRYPVIGIPVLIIAVLFFIFGSKSAKSGHMTRTIRQAYSNQTSNEYQKNLDYLKSKDPNFEELPLIQRVKDTFYKVQKSWMNQEMKPTRYLVSDGIYERFSLQLNIQKNSLVQNIVENVRIINANIVAVDSDHFFDTVHIKITASAVDYYKRTDNGKFVSGSKVNEPFTEYWSFLRRPGAKTISNKGAIEGNCPNCGYLLELTDSVICPTCNAVINSGEYDWVLTEITQSSEWNIRHRKSIPGLENIYEKDPAFNIQHIEDKVSVMFYRNIASQFFADKKYITKLAGESFIKENKHDYLTLPNGKNTFYGDSSIGSVELFEAQLADKDDKFDKLKVKVKWSGHREEAKVPSFIPPVYQKSHIYTQEFILFRDKKVKSSEKNILSSAHCPGCGAPETLNTSGNCEYCGIPLNDGSRDWNLEKVQHFNGYPQFNSQYESLIQKPTNVVGSTPVLSKFDNESTIACATAIMLADGEIDPNEQKLLEQLSDTKGITPEKLSMIIKSVKENGLHIPNPESKEAAQEFLRCMVLMCLANGKVKQSEMTILKKLVSKMGYTDIDINMMIKKERANLYSNAKQYMNS